MKNASKPKNKWIVVADSQKARLLVGRLTEHGRPHLEEKGSLETNYLPSERERSSSQQGGIHHGHVDSSHEGEERVSHFARQLSGWLQGQLQQNQIQDCLVFAPARFLGALRKELPSALQQRVAERHGEMTKMGIGDLAQHPGIAAELKALV